MNRTYKRLSDIGPRIPFGDAGFSKVQLQSVIGALNNETEKQPKASKGSGWEWKEVDVKARQAELRRLIEVWEAADRNIGKLFKRNPDIQSRCTYGKTILIPARNGAAQLAWLPDLQGQNLLPQQAEALNLFVWLLLNPLAKYIGGPCKRCGIYFARSDPRQKTYCKRQCGAAATASTRTKERREDEYEGKIARAQLAIKKWEQAGSKGDWKKSVRGETGFNLRFITQAVTRNRLRSPFGG